MSFPEATNDLTVSNPVSQDPSDVLNSNDALVDTPPSETASETSSDSSVSNPPSQSFAAAPKNISKAQLPERENITPSTKTIFATLGILVPITLLFVALFSGTIQP